MVLLKVVVLAAAISYPATTLAPRVLDRVAGRPWQWQTLGAEPGPPVASGTSSAAGRYTDTVVWTSSDSTAWQWWGSLLPGLVTAVLGYAVLLPFLRLSADALVMTPVQHDLEVRFRVGVEDFVPFVIGLVILVAAECFRQGVRLRDDVAGLV